ncbi:uncharacterized protein DUF922 [Aquimarina sp. MAR_2010_214]|uniref:DUF922 domain-containing protein n=1 Tax=Aquimarina sp. MAR_2010_214 TaxID=1250026 RepID=UPI000C705DA5|nr:DUF922 domain-containing protein [Aquimarina sp. MAR_2010_214]PKV52265.1 uncharacterized protein DUF922 [Aquimarina sp. MAR_2010_214]
MSKCFTIILILFFANNNGYVGKFSYAERSELDWSDFRGKPNLNSSYGASVNTGITYQWSYGKDKGEIELNYQVDSFCYPSLSWVKRGHMSEELLSHEQLHFDISELHARIMRKRLKEYSSGKNIRRDLNKMYKLVERMRINMQERYDEETDHSRNRGAQKKWEKKVETLMWYYRDFTE